MRLLAIDFGTKKCGIAISDPLKIIAQPLKVIFYQDNKKYLDLIEEIKSIINEYSPIEKIILGITKNLDSTLSNTGKITLKFEAILKTHINIPIVLFDEKYSTKTSLEIMQSMNLNNKQKKEKKDAIAAQKILEDYMLKNQN